jgi:hypothetical protein
MGRPAPDHEWLRLLDEEQPHATFDALKQQLLAGAAAPDRDAVEDDASRANRIRDRLEEATRHADELVVLNDLARRLASMRDPGEVLQEVTAQARRLLRTDVAYIMLLQPGGVLRIEYIDGSMGSVMRGITLEPGQGLGGTVLATGEPLWSKAYLDDPRFARGERMVAAATSEQLGGILGVPMLLGEEAIGVLLAADRRPRPFAPREVALLAALASHSAVAINNARLFEQNRTALEDLRRENDLRRQVNELRERLIACVVRGEGITEISVEMTAATGRPVTVYDATNQRLAGVHPVRLEELVGAEGAADLLRGEDGSTVIRFEDVVVAPSRLRSGHAGCLVVTDDTRGDEDLSGLMAIGAAALGLVVSSEWMIAEAELRTRGEFVNALLSPDVDRVSIRRRARNVGIDLDRISVVAVFAGKDEDMAEAGRLASRLSASFQGWSAEHRDHVVALLPGTDIESVRAQLRRLREGPLPSAVGLAPCAGDVDAVRESHIMARQTATVLGALGRGHASAQASELGVYRSLFSQSGRDEIVAFIERTVGPVLRYDNERQRDLAPTLLTYLQQAQHHGRTCQLLNIHANTLYQRLDRVAQLLGEGWREPDAALEIQLALKLSRLLTDLPTG